MGVGEGVGQGAGEGSGWAAKAPDLENRDPNNINDHVKVAFEDVLAEPDGSHSDDCCWNCAYCCYTCSKLCCYRFMTCLCGWYLAFCWGCQFARIAFCHIWCYTPQLRMYMIDCSFYQKVWGTTIQCCLAPICETTGLCFSKVEVKNG